MSGYEKAAPLYMQVKLWDKAFKCYNELELYADAAAALRQGGEFNQLVEYLAKCVVWPLCRDRLILLGD